MTLIKKTTQVKDTKKERTRIIIIIKKKYKNPCEPCTKGDKFHQSKTTVVWRFRLFYRGPYKPDRLSKN